MRSAGKAILVATCLLIFSASADAADFKWYATNEALNNENSKSNIDDAPQKIELKGGWSCEVGPTSINNSRQTVCQNGDKAIEFSVQCDSSRPKDHTQVRFKNLDGKYVDFIEVGCTDKVNAGE